MPLAGVQSSGPVMNWAVSIVSPSTYDSSKVLSAPYVVEHGLLIAITLVIGSAAMSFEALEVLAGIIGALAVCVMKESRSRDKKCVAEPVKPGRKSLPIMADGDIASPMHDAEATKQCRFADGVPQSSACAHAELNRMRVESDLDNLKLKVESDEAELTQLQAEIVKLEKDLVQATETQIDSLLMTISEAKLRAEEVEDELGQTKTKVAELNVEVARAFSLQLKAEETAQASIEACLTDLVEANFQWTEEHMEISWPDELCEPFSALSCASQEWK